MRETVSNPTRQGAATVSDMGECDNDEKRSTGERIRLKRRYLGLTQEELARRIGRDQTSISNFETGAIQPSGSTLRLLAEALDEPIDWISTGGRYRSGKIETVIARLVAAFGEEADELLAGATDEDLATMVRILRAIKKA